MLAGPRRNHGSGRDGPKQDSHLSAAAAVFRHLTTSCRGVSDWSLTVRGLPRVRSGLASAPTTKGISSALQCRRRVASDHRRRHLNGAPVRLAAGHGAGGRAKRPGRARSCRQTLPSGLERIVFDAGQRSSPRGIGPRSSRPCLAGSGCPRNFPQALSPDTGRTNERQDEADPRSYLTGAPAPASAHRHIIDSSAGTRASGRDSSPGAYIGSQSAPPAAAGRCDPSHQFDLSRSTVTPAEGSP